MNREVFTFGVVVMLLIVLALLGTSTNACTEFLVSSVDGGHVVGRSMEFGIDLESELVIQSRGDVFEMPRVEGKVGMSWKNEFGYAYLNGRESEVVADGMNERGLSVGCLYLPGYAKYQEARGGDAKRSIPNDLLGHWLLGNFSDVDEIKEAISDVVVYGRVVDWVGSILPLHYSVYDRRGKGIVIEYTDGQLQVFENRVGVLTNSPPFDWQLENLQNFLGLKAWNPEPERMGDMVVKPAGQGFGLLGLPGDYSPPSRFARILVLREAAVDVANTESGVGLAVHLLNTVDIAKGMVRPAKEDRQDDFDYTQWIVIKALNEKRLYYRTYSSISLYMVDLSKVDFKEGLKRRVLKLSKEPVVIDQTWRMLKDAGE
ncbi:Choloylglycine hydrolase [Poriferisphaera corsica]|uniref:Choloylglycine hydrolase n=1 Tax=Poriferisphaera corsica TaxID=2528020 RepID=A0A517YPL6_9BACT|nr:choloylglycine hydrolase family protein [Poriferisphaera corsica]QDU32158.1 Choloylglycine hydrolase [Poriferisphaera corsica]